MAVTGEGIVELTRRDIAASGLGSDPKAIAAFESLQEAAYRSGPAATEEVKEAAAVADSKAETAQGTADAAQATAASATAAAAAAQDRADDAYDLADTKVTKSLGPPWAAPTGTASRAALASYAAPTISNPPTQAEVQALADYVQAMSRALVAVITDGRDNQTLTP